MGMVYRIVVPAPRRQPILELSHEKAGHIEVKKVRSLINRRFTWPEMSQDIEQHVSSCNLCTHFNKADNKTAKVMDCPILSELFQHVAVDMVGPLPKGRGRARYVLTYVCLTSRWPEGVPLRTGTAAEVAEP